MGTGNERWARVVGGLWVSGVGGVCEWVVGRCVISEADPAEAAERRVNEDGREETGKSERDKTVSNGPHRRPYQLIVVIDAKTRTTACQSPASPIADDGAVA